MIDAKRAIITKHNNEYVIKHIKPIKIINWHERNKQLINYELMCKNGKAVKLIEK